MICNTVNSISEAHRWLVSNIIWTHSDLLTEDEEVTWEGQSVAITITAPLVDMINPLSSFQQQRCEEYANQLIQGVKTDIEPDKRFSYTYHERLYMKSQYDDVLLRLMESEITRRAVLYTWLPLIDNNSTEVPCLQFVHYTIRNGKLNCFVCFRSEDMISAYGPNAFAIARLQEHVANALSLPVGSYTHIVTIPHLYPARDAEDLKRWM